MEKGYRVKGLDDVKIGLLTREEKHSNYRVELR